MLSFKEYLDESSNWKSQLHSVSGHAAPVNHSGRKPRSFKVRPKPVNHNQYSAIGHAVGSEVRKAIDRDVDTAKKAISTASSYVNRQNTSN